MQLATQPEQRNQCASLSKKFTVSKVTKKKASALPVQHALTKPRRPLNSWMAFRSYYSPIFISYQQKDISGYLTVLWQSDPFKAKWSILAKAYSIIRYSKEQFSAPLDGFLALNCPHIGIIGPVAYLTQLGWKLVEQDGNKSLERELQANTGSFDEHLQTSNLSVEDILGYCHITGYLTDEDMRTLNNPSGSDPSSLIMATRPAQHAAMGIVDNATQSFTVRPSSNRTHSPQQNVYVTINSPGISPIAQHISYHTPSAQPFNISSTFNAPTEADIHQNPRGFACILNFMQYNAFMPHNTVGQTPSGPIRPPRASFSSASGPNSAQAAYSMTEFPNSLVHGLQQASVGGITMRDNEGASSSHTEQLHVRKPDQYHQPLHFESESFIDGQYSAVDDNASFFGSLAEENFDGFNMSVYGDGSFVANED